MRVRAPAPDLTGRGDLPRPTGGFFPFGHHPPPYAESAREGSILECAGCHMTNVSKTDMVYVQFYPILHAKRNR